MFPWKLWTVWQGVCALTMDQKVLQCLPSRQSAISPAQQFPEILWKANSPFHLYSLLLPGPSPPEPLTMFCHEMKLLVKVSFSTRM